MSFPSIPSEVIEYIRATFAKANDKVSKTLSLHPSMYEETLDHTLVTELAASPPTFFSTQQIGLEIQTHWLGGRHMYGRWEIADIGLFVIIRVQGKLHAKKVALLQAKRLFSREIPVSELFHEDYRIGIGRIIDKDDPIVPISQQRNFQFDENCVFGAMSSGSEQSKRIEKYRSEKGIPIYYNFYCPTNIPFQNSYPAMPNEVDGLNNDYGVRVSNSEVIHSSLNLLPTGKTPSLAELTQKGKSKLGTRLEDFVCDELLVCKAGRLFEKNADADLNSLLYARSNPITAAISICIDFAQKPELVE